VANTRAYYPKSPRFGSRPTGRVPRLRFAWFSPVLQGKCRCYLPYLKYLHPHPITVPSLRVALVGWVARGSISSAEIQGSHSEMITFQSRKTDVSTAETLGKYARPVHYDSIQIRPQQLPSLSLPIHQLLSRLIILLPDTTKWMSSTANTKGHHWGWPCVSLSPVVLITYLHKIQFNVIFPSPRSSMWPFSKSLSLHLSYTPSPS
jgi:hypothetical protein